MKRFFLFITFPFAALAQFAPAAGQPGTTAVHKDSSIIVGWATNCVITRGPQDISIAPVALASHGEPSLAVGPADNPNVVSLGDGGSAVLTFQSPIKNGSGPDFCVFENSFDPGFLELAFVEVSSDGINFIRFPATSNQQYTLQIGPFDTNADPTKLNNLAGKYVGNYGVPFDLQELQGVSGLDINNITHVKIIDAVGCIQTQYASYDQNNNIINDLWPTAFASSGFDLDAVGVIHHQPVGIEKYEKNQLNFTVYPTLVSSHINIFIDVAGTLEVKDISGKTILSTSLNARQNIMHLENLSAGVYFISLKGERFFSRKFIKLD